MTMWLPDLTQRGGPRYRAIAAALHDDIVSGRLPAGAKLPTHRDLAWKLGVTVGTVTRAYAEAERQGLIGGEVGRGTFVLAPQRMSEVPLAPPPDGVVDMSVNAMALWPDIPAIRQAMEEVARRPDLAQLLAYQPVNGPARFRAAGAAYIAATSGLEVGEDRVMLTAGGQNATFLAYAAVTRPGDVVLVEQLTYAGIKPIAAMLGLRLVPVAMDGDGLIPEAVEQACRLHGAHALYCMPNLHNPTTVTMPPGRRRELVAVARRMNLTIIEDDVYGFLAPCRHETLAALAPDLVIYLTSVSKSLMPGLRVGYIVPPRQLADRMTTGLRAMNLGTCQVGTAAASLLIESGEADRIAARRRAVVSERQEIARRVLGRDLPGSDPGCTHLWIPLPEPWRREEFARELLARGVRVSSADAFAVARGDIPHAIRVCICSTDRADALEQGLRTVADLLDDPMVTSSPVV
ncbi:MAG TPA: PLP-dependent aminotransferase family protein [Azospirillaceae bacterium]|nr:PLP-dependent aminotransferase family protein [Azospirillaceae bacterium]